MPLSAIDLNFPLTHEIKFWKFWHLFFLLAYYELQDLDRAKRKKQCYIYHFITYEMLILNKYIFKGHLYSSGNILDCVSLEIQRDLVNTEN